MRRLSVVAGTVLVILALLGSAVGWSGVVQVPIFSAVFGMDHARDLGMQRDRQAFERFCATFGIERPSDPSNYTLASPHHWDGSVAVDGLLSETALGSLREFNSVNPYLSGINFRIHDGYVEMAAFVKSVPGYPFSGPVYGQFSLSRTGSNSVSLTITQLEFGHIGVPTDQINEATDKISAYLNDTIAKAGITIDALELREGGIYFRGSWPKTITADPPAQGQIP